MTVGETRRPVEAGSMFFAPKGAWMGFENTGAEDARVMGIFSKLGYEEYLRATSVPEGQDVTPLTPEELAAMERRGYMLTSEIEPFPYDDRFGTPERADLQFVVLRKRL